MKLKLHLFLFTLLAFATTIQAQSLEDIVEHTWTGSSVQDANFTRSGKAYLNQNFRFTLNTADYSLRGTAVSTITLDGITYKATCSLTGWLYTDSNRLYYKSSEISSDKLPNGLQWCPSWGYLTFYKNKGKPGYYLLKGFVDDTCGGNSELELGDD